MKVKELWKHVRDMQSAINELETHADDIGFDDEDENEMTKPELRETKRIAHLIFDGLRPIINEREFN